MARFHLGLADLQRQEAAIKKNSEMSDEIKKIKAMVEQAALWVQYGDASMISAHYRMISDACDALSKKYEGK